MRHNITYKIGTATCEKYEDNLQDQQSSEHTSIYKNKPIINSL